jgi:hypothetical protein
MSLTELPCIQCENRPERSGSRFCSEECKEEYTATCHPAIACRECDEFVEDLDEAKVAGWTDVELDVEGWSWNHLGLCPDCTKLEND